MAQLEEKGYADKYRRLGQPIHLVGVEFSREERNVARIRGRARLSLAAAPPCRRVPSRDA